MTYQIFHRVLDQKDIDTLLAYNRVDDHVTDARPDVRSKNPVWNKDDFPQDILQSTLDEILPDPYEVEDVLFFQSKISFRLHADSGLRPNDRIYRNVLLPLEFSGPASTVLFDNHWFGTSTRFARSNIDPNRYNLPDRDGNFVWVDDIRTLLQQCRVDPDSVERFTVNDEFVNYLEQLIHIRQHADARTSDYSLIENYRPDAQIEASLYDKYLYHIPAQDLDGLSVDIVYEWNKGGALTFPRTQLHCAGAGHKEKIGVSVFTKIKI